MDDIEKMLVGGEEGIKLLNLDDNRPAQKIIEWNGLKIGLQYLPFEQRHGKLLKSGYGHIQKTKGADGMALDVYVGTKLESSNVYSVAQVINGIFDEEKIIIGVSTLEEAKQIYLDAMPQEFLGSIKEISIAELNSYRTDLSGEDIRRDYLAGIITREDAMRMRGYQIPSPSPPPPFFSDEIDDYDDGEIFAIAHKSGGTLGFNYDSEESAADAFLFEHPFINEVTVTNVTDLIFSPDETPLKTDNKKGSLKKVRGNLCRDSGGRFVSCNGAVSKKSYKKSAKGKEQVAIAKEITNSFINKINKGDSKSGLELAVTMAKHGIDDSGIKLTDNILRMPVNQKKLYSYFNDKIKLNNPDAKQRERVAAARELTELFTQKFGEGKRPSEQISKDLSALMFRNNLDLDGVDVYREIMNKPSSKRKIEDYFFNKQNPEFTGGGTKKKTKPKREEREPDTPTNRLINSLNVNKGVKDKLKSNLDFSEPSQVIDLGKTFSNSYKIGFSEDMPEVKAAKQRWQDEISKFNKSKNKAKDYEKVRDAELNYLKTKGSVRRAAADEMERMRTDLKKAHNLNSDDVNLWSSDITFNAGSEHDNNRIKKDIEEVYQLTGGKIDTLDNVFRDPDKPRAYANIRGDINIGDGSKETIFHEAGHHVEFTSGDFEDAAGKWIRDRADSRTTKKLKDITGVNYDDDEVALTDKWVSPYVGKIYEFGSTEVLSMGIERFASRDSMRLFYEQDPEHFNLIVGMLLKPREYDRIRDK